MKIMMKNHKIGKQQPKKFLLKMSFKKRQKKIVCKLRFTAVFWKTIILVRLKPRNLVSEMNMKLFLQKFSGKCGLLAVIGKTKIRIKRKIWNSESATLKHILVLYLKKGKKILGNFRLMRFFGGDRKSITRMISKPCKKWRNFFANFAENSLHFDNLESYNPD